MSPPLEQRSDGTGLVVATKLPEEGHAMPLVFSKGGQAFVDWIRSEAEYRKSR